LLIYLLSCFDIEMTFDGLRVKLSQQDHSYTIQFNIYLSNKLHNQTVNKMLSLKYLRVNLLN